MELEGIAIPDSGLELAFGIEQSDELLIDPAPLVKELVISIRNGDEKSAIAAAFHRAVVSALVDSSILLRNKTGLNRVVLGGGCFQNRLLLEGCLSSLESAGFQVFSNCTLPCNDGSISLGQAVIAGEWEKRGLI